MSRHRVAGGAFLAVAIAIVFGASAATASVSYTCGTVTGAASKLLDNGNIGAVQNGATSPTFTTKKQMRVVELCTYHWNNGSGTTSPGTIGITNTKTNKQYGPWQASGKPGMGGVPNAYWLAKVSVLLPAGSYKVTDSDPNTWAQNSGTGGKGMSFVIARPATTTHTLAYTCGTVTGTASKIFDNGNIGAVANGGKSPTFTTTKTWRLAEICTYHWNSGAGKAAPGKIGLQNVKSGKHYGPWRASGKPGMGGVKNAYWIAKASVVLPKGTYRITDSDTRTWSQNSGTHGRGMAFVIVRPK